MRWTRTAIAAAVGGTLIGPDGPVDGVTIDSREVTPGSLFVPLVAARDGHEFIEAARTAGASAWFTSRAEAPFAAPGAIVVGDTAEALTALGRAARSALPDRVIGVTGSAGKTSTKDLIAGILRAHAPAAASAKSFNNELGVPLTLANAPDDAWAAVIEMGARGIGHIATLCGVARPTVGVVTNIGTAHLEMFGSARTIADAKGELLESLPVSGTAVLDLDGAMFEVLRAKVAARVLTFSATGSAGADLRASGVSLDATLHPSFHLASPWGGAAVRIGARGAHQVANALAAAAASLAVGSTLDEVVSGLATEELSSWRMELVTTPGGAVVLNDAYNANPSSMAAALDALASLPGSRRIAVLGTMAELGPDRDRLHRDVVARAEELRIDLVLAVDEDAYGVETVGSVAAAAARLGALGPGDVVLVKGSRVAGLERLAALLCTPGGVA